MSMAEELRAVRGVDSDDTPALAQALTRLVVLPFRVLRPDAETDFLAFSLPDAISTSLSGIGSLIVRSSATAARFAGEAPDLRCRRGGGRCRSRGHGNAAPIGRPAASGGAARRGAGRHADHVTDGAVVARRSVQAAGRHRPARRGGAVASVGRSSAARPHQTLRTRPRLRALPPGERARAHLRWTAAGPRSVSALPWSSIPAFAPAWAHLGRCHRVIGKYIDGTLGQRRARRGSVPPRARAEPAPLDRAQVLRQPRGRHRSGAAGARAAARRGHPSRQRSGAVRRPRPRVPLLRALRRVDRGARRGAPARSERPDERRADAADDRGHRSTSGRRADADCRGRATPASGSSASAWPGAGTRRGGHCSRCTQTSRIPLFQSWTGHLMAWLDRRPADMLTGIAAPQHV